MEIEPLQIVIGVAIGLAIGISLKTLIFIRLNKRFEQIREENFHLVTKILELQNRNKMLEASLARAYQELKKWLNVPSIVEALVRNKAH